MFNKRKLYPKELKENTSFQSWAERFFAWVAMDEEEIARAFHRAGQQKQPLDTSGLTERQASYQLRYTATCVRSLRDTARPRILFGLSSPSMVLRHGAA